MTGAAGIGLATLAADGSVLDTWFPAPELTESGTSATSRLAVSDVPVELAALIGRDDDRRTETIAVRTVIGSLDDVAADPYDAYLRLHLLSHRLVAPHGLNAGGLFGVLTNVVWTNHGPCAIDGFEAVRARLRRRGPVTVYGVDKFPRMVDYVVPTGVRIADADRVRLGAHLAPGTTVMHEGFVNYNAGTLGARWWKAASRRVWWWATAPMSAAERRSWARCLAVEHTSFRSEALSARRQLRSGHLTGRRLRGGGRAVRDRRHEGHHARQQFGQGA